MNNYLGLLPWAVLALLSTYNFQLSTARGAPGDLDSLFAGTGKSRVGFGGGEQFCYAAAVQGDGKLVLAGSGNTGGFQYEFEIVRLDTNNVLDTSFGAGGVVFTPFNPTSVFANGARAAAVKIQADGKIVAAGGNDSAAVYTDFALARYNPDGSLDTTFGTGGKVVTDFGMNSSINAMVIDANSNIVVAGTAGTNFALARYDTNGVLDASFGSGGTVTTDVGGGFAEQGAHGLLIEGNGYVAVGTGLNGSAFAVARYTANGALDGTFGGGSGKVFTSIPGYVTAYAHAVGYQFGNNTVLNPDRILVAGGTFNSSLDAIYAVVRYNLDGSLDTSFGSGGIVKDAFGTSPIANVNAILVQGQSIQPRKITVAGFGESGGPGFFAMARYNANGALDTTFGGGTGKASIALGPGGAEAYALAVQGGRLVLAGYSSPNLSGSISDFAAARFSSSGVLDTSFGNDGVVTANLCGYAQTQGVAIQNDGKAVLAGIASNGTNNVFALARYNSDGTLDGSFGVSGRVTTTVNATNSTANAVQVQADGKIVVAGYTYTGFYIYREFALVRYNSDGTLDSSFGSGGQVLTTVGGMQDLAKAIALQPDGKIVVAGSSYNGFDDDFAVVRYTANGLPDGSFGGTGKVTTTIANGEDVADAVAVQPDGKIVVAGYAGVASNTNFALVRYNSDGSLDNSFGAFGRVSTDFGSGNRSYGYGVALQPDGKIVLAGGAYIGGQEYIALTRYTTSGLLDASFGAGGKVTNHVGLTFDQANAVAVLPNGKIVVAGFSAQGSEYAYAILRYNINGSLDSSYGLGGEVIVTFEDGGDSGNALALDQIGRAVVAGRANELFGVARLASEPFLKITSVHPLNSGDVMIRGVGIPTADHTLYASPNLSPGTFSILGPVTADVGGFWQGLDTNAVGLNMRFYRLSYP